jgi:hypothetical protein
MDRRDGEKDLTGVRGFLARGIQMIIDGEASVVVGGDEDTNEMQKRVTSSIIWSATMHASCGNEEQRPEMEAASGVNGVGAVLQNQTILKHQEMHQREKGNGT